MPRRLIPVTISENLLREAETAAKYSRLTVRQFCEEVIESALAERRLRVLPLNQSGRDVRHGLKIQS
jgi:hypothetical protein